ncbi:hypothetical protein DSO57_1025794 [Entomophthora muscae]|uniref:Uncharacterized protein n=1 Tax=Entomophthora muscae TaxID=34485 RepID=A0ACC2U0P5_9FUNG|nr:hypothetical protein DSO57_1025794 [Entomophthora muscae]
MSVTYTLLTQQYIGPVDLGQPVRLDHGVQWNENYWSLERMPAFLISDSGSSPVGSCIKGGKQCLEITGVELWVDAPVRVSEVTICQEGYECRVIPKSGLFKQSRVTSTLGLGDSEWKQILNSTIGFPQHTDAGYLQDSVQAVTVTGRSISYIWFKPIYLLLEGKYLEGRINHPFRAEFPLFHTSLALKGLFGVTDLCNNRYNDWIFPLEKNQTQKYLSIKDGLC